jgi:hypothetical protein
LNLKKRLQESYGASVCRIYAWQMNDYLLTHSTRIQGLATPNTIAISEATYRLVQDYFECQDLGAQTLRGVAEPLHVYRVLQESGARGRLDVAVPRGLTPLVGREQEVGLLLERWEQVKAGQGQVVLLTGDAGIGKSRLAQVLKDHVANEPHMRWECRSAEYAQNTALFPLVDLFQRMLRFHAEDTSDEKLGKLEQALSQYRLPLEESVQLFAPLFSLPLPEDRYAPLNVSLRHEVARLIVWHVVTRPVAPSAVSYEDVREGNDPCRALGHGTHSLWTGA